MNKTHTYILNKIYIYFFKYHIKNRQLLSIEPASPTSRVGAPANKAMERCKDRSKFFDMISEDNEKLYRLQVLEYLSVDISPIACQSRPK